MPMLLVIDNGFILITALVFYIMSMWLAYKTRTNWLFVASALLWFIPIVLIENTFIVIFSVIMLLFTATLGFVNRNEE